MEHIIFRMNRAYEMLAKGEEPRTPTRVCSNIQAFHPLSVLIHTLLSSPFLRFFLVRYDEYFVFSQPSLLPLARGCKVDAYMSKFFLGFWASVSL